MLQTSKAASLPKPGWPAETLQALDAGDELARRRYG